MPLASGGEEGPVAKVAAQAGADAATFTRERPGMSGYSDGPSVLQVVAYGATLAIIVVLTKAFGPRRAPVAKARRAAAG